MLRLAVLGCVAGALLAGCVSAPAEAPAWYADRDQQGAEDYPSLREVPLSSTANTNAAYWNRVEEELVAVGDAVKQHPRAQPATAAEDPNAFIEEAREELEETRQSHTP